MLSIFWKEIWQEGHFNSLPLKGTKKIWRKNLCEEGGELVGSIIGLIGPEDEHGKKGIFKGEIGLKVTEETRALDQGDSLQFGVVTLQCFLWLDPLTNPFLLKPALAISAYEGDLALLLLLEKDVEVIEIAGKLVLIGVVWVLIWVRMFSRLLLLITLQMEHLK